MPPTLNPDPVLLQAAIDLDPGISIDTILDQALKRYIDYRKQMKIIELFGTIDYEEDYDYKEQRSVSWASLLIQSFGH